MTARDPFGTGVCLGQGLAGMIVRTALLAVAAMAFAVAPFAGEAARAESKGKPTRADVEARLKKLFPAGHREGREGVMKLGGQFRTVTIRTWAQCRQTCLESPAVLGVSGCALWTYIKAADPKMPNVCRMWWDLPELRANAAAVSGAGRLK